MTRTKRRSRKRIGRNLSGFEYADFVRPKLFLLTACFAVLSGGLCWVANNASGDWRIGFATTSAIAGSMAIYFLISQRRLSLMLQSLRRVEQMRLLSPTGFECFVARLLRQRGYHNVKQQGGSGDRGIDVIAEQNGVSTAIQCKRYVSGRKVTSPELQTFVGALHIANADQGIFVTTSTFTTEAKKIAALQGILLVDELELAKWMR